ncbi:MAG: cell division protein ZapA [Deltaproteobacteria bacterium]|nr:cell division protein ZapA [Candidatus Anaeroferrophillus wilburensis]MBN2889961.1 cell division protein ZapA [Deltaproteobacteria bacterium]
MLEKKSVTVAIKGQEYTIKTEADEVHVHSVAEEVNGRLRSLDQKTQTINTINLMVLALMNITSDYLQVKSELDSLTSRLEQLNRKFPA